MRLSFFCAICAAATAYGCAKETTEAMSIVLDAGDAGVEPPAVEEELPADMCGDLRIAPHIFYGTEAPTAVPLTAGQMMAIGTTGPCSGTLIAPRWVLTGKHCDTLTTQEFCMGATRDRFEGCVAIERVIDYPDADSDLALLELAKDASREVPSVTPIPLFTEEMSGEWSDRVVEVAGFGRTETGSNTARKFASLRITNVGPTYFLTTGDGERGACFGDSGGPALAPAADGTVRVVASAWRGAEDCISTNAYARVDALRDWIESYVGPTRLDGTPCGAIDAVGRCIDGRSVRCEAGELRGEDCAGGCGWDAARERFGCITEADPCGGVDGFGRCDGSIARWCHRGIVRARDCGACGEGCRPVSDVVGVDCAPDPCDSVDFLGRCDGDTMEWCEDGQFLRIDCTIRGDSCTWQDGRGAACMGAGVTGA